LALKKPYVSLQTKITLLVCGVVALALLMTNVLISSHIAENTQKNLAEKASDIARMTACSLVVIEALNTQRDDTDIQTFTNYLLGVTKVEFIVVMDMNGIRKSHPDPTKIGQHFVGGDEIAALQGQEYVSVAAGTLGPSLRAFAPIFAPDGRQLGAVSVGILLDDVEQTVAQGRSIIYFGTGLGLLVGIIGAVLLARNIKKTLFGLEPFTIAKLLEERSAMLQSVREGILSVDKESRITLVNQEAARLFQLAGIDIDPAGKKVDECIPNTRLTDVLASGQAELDQEQDIHGVIILTNRFPIIVNGEIVGAIATFRDKTEMSQLAEQLTGVRNYAEALRSQAHEFRNKLHVILGLVRMESYDQLASYIKTIAHDQQTEVNFVGIRIKDPVVAGFLLGKLSRARELGVELTLAKDSFLPESNHPEVNHELITIVGNLLANALEAVANSTVKRVNVYFHYDNSELNIEVIDTGPGMSPQLQEAIFTKGYSTKADNRGLGLFLVQSSLDRLGGEIEVLSEPGKGTRFIVTLPYESKGVQND